MTPTPKPIPEGKALRKRYEKVKTAVQYKLITALIFWFEEPFFPILMIVLGLWLAEGVAEQSGWAGSCPVR